MILRLAVAVIAAVLFAASPGWAAITEITSQRIQTSTSSGSPKTAAYPANVTAGNVMACGGVYSIGTFTISDTRSSTWIKKFDSTGPSPFIALAVVPTTGANTVSISPDSGDNFAQFTCTEFTGSDVASLIDVDGGFSTGTSTTPSDGLTTNTANAMILGVYGMSGCAANPDTITEGGSYTKIDEQENGACCRCFSFVKRLATTATSYTVDLTTANSRTWSVYTLALKEAVAAGRPRLLLRGGDE